VNATIAPAALLVAAAAAIGSGGAFARGDSVSTLQADPTTLDVDAGTVRPLVADAMPRDRAAVGETRQAARQALVAHVASLRD
jgi:hypothetical protein